MGRIEMVFVMGLGIRLSRNVRAYFPWWVVILAYLVWAPIYLAIWILVVTYRVAGLIVQAVKKRRSNAS